MLKKIYKEDIEAAIRGSFPEDSEKIQTKM